VRGDRAGPAPRRDQAGRAPHRRRQASRRASSARAPAPTGRRAPDSSRARRRSPARRPPSDAGAYEATASARLRGDADVAEVSELGSPKTWQGRARLYVRNIRACRRRIAHVDFDQRDRARAPDLHRLTGRSSGSTRSNGPIRGVSSRPSVGLRSGRPADHVRRATSTGDVKRPQGSAGQRRRRRRRCGDHAEAAAIGTRAVSMTGRWLVDRPAAPLVRTSRGRGVTPLEYLPLVAQPARGDSREARSSIRRARMPRSSPRRRRRRRRFTGERGRSSTEPGWCGAPRRRFGRLEPLEIARSARTYGEAAVPARPAGRHRVEVGNRPGSRPVAGPTLPRRGPRERDIHLAARIEDEQGARVSPFSSEPEDHRRRVSVMEHARGEHGRRTLRDGSAVVNDGFGAAARGTPRRRAAGGRRHGGGGRARAGGAPSDEAPRPSSRARGRSTGPG
jgi:hypothetical protein